MLFCFASDTWIGVGRSHLTPHKWAKALQLDLAMGPKAGIKWRGLPNKGWLKSLLSYIWMHKATEAVNLLNLWCTATHHKLTQAPKHYFSSVLEPKVGLIQNEVNRLVRLIVTHVNQVEYNSMYKGVTLCGIRQLCIYIYLYIYIFHVYLITLLGDFSGITCWVHTCGASGMKWKNQEQHNGNATCNPIISG